MDGVSRAVGSGVISELLGSRYVLNPLTLRLIGVLENALLRERPCVEQQLYEKGYEDEDLLQCAREADERNSYATIEEIMVYLTTVEGLSDALWLSIGGEVPYDKVYAWVENADPEDLRRVFNDLYLATGFHLFASQDWKMRQKDSGDERIDWRVKLRQISEAFFTDPGRCGDLTLYQVRMMSEREIGKQKVSAGEAKERYKRGEFDHLPWADEYREIMAKRRRMRQRQKAREEAARRQA